MLILAHRNELIEQARDKYRTMFGELPGKIKADENEIRRVTVGSIQTMSRRRYAPELFPTIIVDEAHHAVSNQYQSFLQQFPDSRVLGVSATLDRGDKRSLSEYFDSVAYEYSMRKAISDGYLVPIKARMIPLKIDISQVRMSQGDYSLEGTAHALEPYLEQIAEEMETYCADRKTVVFLPLVRISQEFCEILNRHGFRAVEVNGNSPDREEKLADFDAGKYGILCNSMLLTEGWDCPSVDCIIVLRPTRSRGLYQQMLGRGTRLFPGKDHLLVLDFLWLTEEHDLCRPSSLTGKSDKVKGKLDKMVENAEDAVNVNKISKSIKSTVFSKREPRPL